MNESKFQTGKYAGVTFVIRKDIGTHFLDQYLRREFERANPSSTDYLRLPEEENYLGMEKLMIVLGKSSQEEKTILYDKSDKFFATLTILFRLTHLSNLEHVAREIMHRTLQENGLLEISKNASYIYVERALFQGSEEEQLDLKNQNENLYIEIECNKIPKMRVKVSKRILNEIPKHEVWENVNTIHKIIADQQKRTALKCFYAEKLSIMKEELNRMKAEYANFGISEFYHQLYHIESQLIEIRHEEDTFFIERELSEIKNNYESMVHTKNQQILSKLQRSQLLISVIIGVLTVGAIVGVGLRQASIAEEIGLRQTSIMEEQKTILAQQTEIQNEQYTYISQEGLRVFDWKPRDRVIFVHGDLPTNIALYIENLGARDIYITDVELFFSYTEDSFSISLSNLDQNFQDIKIGRYTTEKVEIQVNPFAYGIIPKSRLEELLNQDLDVTIRIHTYKTIPLLEWRFKLIIVRDEVNI